MKNALLPLALHAYQVPRPFRQFLAGPSLMFRMGVLALALSMGEKGRPARRPALRWAIHLPPRRCPSRRGGTALPRGRTPGRSQALSGQEMTSASGGGGVNSGQPLLRPSGAVPGPDRPL
jgi:hypothetical protein